VSITIAPIANRHRTFADLINAKMDIFGLHSLGKEPGPKTASLVAEIDYHQSRVRNVAARKSIYHSISHEFGLANLFAGQSDA